MKHLTLILSIAAVAALTPACSMLNKSQKQAKTTQTEQQQKEAAVVAGANASETPRITSDALNGEWTIVKVGDTAVPQEDEMPYINFETATGRFYAFNGCNVLNGSFSLIAGDMLQFSGVASTMKFCHDVPFEQTINALLGGEIRPAVKISKVGHEGYIVISDSQSGMSITARRHNMDFLNGQWQVVQINGKDINDEEANIFIDLNEMKVHGNTGCNYFNGTLYIDPLRSNSIDFGNMALTRMACPKFEQEQAMMLGLEETASAIEGDNGRVMLLKASGEPVIVLQKQAVEKP